MALTATISLSASTVLVNATTICTVTVSNSGGAAINLASVVPLAYATSSPYINTAPCGLGLVDLGPGADIVIPASGSLIVRFNATFYGPSTGAIGAGLGTYSVGARCVAADGTTFFPTPATITVNPLRPPGLISWTNSTLVAASSSVASGSSDVLTLTTYDDQHNRIPVGGYTAVISNNADGTATGTLGSTTDNGDGTYSASFTGVLVGTADTFLASVNGRPITSSLPTISVTVGVISPVSSLITVASPTVSASSGTDVITLTAKDAAGNALAAGGATVVFTKTGGTSTGTIGATTDNSNGTYTATFTGTGAGTATTIHATINAVSVTSSPLPTITCV